MARLREVVNVVARLLAGQAVTLEGRHVQVRDAKVEGPAGGATSPSPSGQDIPTCSASERSEPTSFALSGLGRTLPDGRVPRAHALSLRRLYAPLVEITDAAALIG